MSRALPCGDYGVVADGRLVAAVERKSLPDLVSSVTNGKLRYALGDLATLPRAAVVVEDRYSALFKQRHARPAAVADALASQKSRLGPPNRPRRPRLRSPPPRDLGRLAKGSLTADTGRLPLPANVDHPFGNAVAQEPACRAVPQEIARAEPQYVRPRAGIASFRYMPLPGGSRPQRRCGGETRSGPAGALRFAGSRPILGT